MGWVLWVDAHDMAAVAAMIVSVNSWPFFATHVALMEHSCGKIDIRSTHHDHNRALAA